MEINKPPKRFYFDDSQFSFMDKLRPREVYLIGGFSVGFEQEHELEQKITEVKQEFGLERRHPVKWNLQDLRKYYSERHEEALFDKLMKVPDDIRSSLLSTLSSDNLKTAVFASAIVRLKTKSKPSLFYQRCLTNLLQRLAKNTCSAELSHSVFLDFFKEDSTAIAACYSEGFHFGKDPEGNNYHTGPLSGKCFSQCLYFGKTIFNQFLQLADLVTGCSKDFIECCLKKKDFGRVSKFFPLIMPLLLKETGTNMPLKVGLVIAPAVYYKPLEEGYNQVLKQIS